MTVPVDDPVAAGRALLRRGDSAGARACFLRASPDGMVRDGVVLEGLARASYLEREYGAALDSWQLAYAAHREADDRVGAIRAARTLGYMYFAVVGDRAVAGGWLSRATTMLVDLPDSPETGWVALNCGMFEDDRARKEQLFTHARTVGRQAQDTDLEFLAVAYLGANLVHADRTVEGMTLLDEALAAVAGNDVDDFCALEEIFCQLFSACEYAHDVTRADQWIRVGEAVAVRRRLPAVSAFCNTHYGAVLTAAGRWPEADAALTEAVRLWGLGQKSLRGGALIRLADLRVRQGRFEDAEQLLTGEEGSLEAALPLASISLARGQTSVARDTLERALAQLPSGGTAAAPLLVLLLEVHLAAFDVDAARQVLTELEECAAAYPSGYLAGAAALARGRLCLAAGDGDPRACLREAINGFTQAQLPRELAQARLALAKALVVDAPEVATAEARAALKAFDQLSATGDAAAAAAVLRSLGVATTAERQGGELLTKRESEVLELLGHGLSNPEISDRLYISRKTVEHHVGNVLSKLGLRNRAAAAGFAARGKPATK